MKLTQNNAYGQFLLQAKWQQLTGGRIYFELQLPLSLAMTGTAIDGELVFLWCECNAMYLQPRVKPTEIVQKLLAMKFHGIAVRLALCALKRLST